MDGKRIMGGRKAWVRVGSEVEGGQVDFECVCVCVFGWGSLKGTGVCLIDRGAV